MRGESDDLGGTRPDGVLMASGRALPQKGAKWLRTSGRIKLPVRTRMTAHVRTLKRFRPDFKIPSVRTP
jgi:hypothetical protein